MIQSILLVGMLNGEKFEIRYWIFVCHSVKKCCWFWSAQINGKRNLVMHCDTKLNIPYVEFFSHWINLLRNLTLWIICESIEKYTMISSRICNSTSMVITVVELLFVVLILRKETENQQPLIMICM